MTARDMASVDASIGTIGSGSGPAKSNGHGILQRGPTTLQRRNIYLAGRRTSIQLEPAMWSALEEISAIEAVSVDDLCTKVAGRKAPSGSLSSAMRVFIMAYFKDAATADGHRQAGHGRGNPVG